MSLDTELVLFQSTTLVLLAETDKWAVSLIY